MMKNNNVRMIVGIFFLLYGVLSLSAIVYRGSRHFPSTGKPYWQQHKPSAQDFSQAREELSQRLNQPIEVHVHVNRQYAVDTLALRMFFGVVALEYSLSFLYILTGIALIRKYLFGTLLIQSVLLCDIMLKVFFKFVLYYSYQHWPNTLQIFQLIRGYFIPDCSLMSYVSGLLTGAVFVAQPRYLFMAYGFMVVCTMFVVAKLNANNPKHG